jgi:hypothetical protein
VTAEAERSVIATSIIESALIPTSLESVVESLIVVVSTGLAELEEARLFTKSVVGICRSESTTKAECAQAHCAGNHGPGCDFLETHNANSFVLLSGPTKDCGKSSSISVQVRCVDLIGVPCGLIASRDVQGTFFLCYSTTSDHCTAQVQHGRRQDLRQRSSHSCGQSNPGRR